MNIKQIGKNQLEISIGNKILLQSYNTIVAAKINGICYKTEQYYSKTTSKHINIFLNESHTIEKNQDFFNNLLE